MRSIETVSRSTLELVLPLVAEYQRFYRTEPDEERNRRFFGRLIEEPSEGVQFLAREGESALGFATLYFPLSSVSAARQCLMNDLYVRPEARGKGVGRALIGHCARWAGGHGYPELYWQTERANDVAQRLYESMGALRSEWLTYTLPTFASGTLAPAEERE